MTNANQPLFGTKAVSKATDQLMSVQTEQTITSLEVAELTGKRHDSVFRDIRNILSRMDEISLHNFVESTYTSDRVVRAQYIGCADNSLLIFQQFIN